MWCGGGGGFQNVLVYGGFGLTSHSGAEHIGEIYCKDNDQEGIVRCISPIVYKILH